MRRSRHHRRLPDLPDRHRAGGDPAGRDRDHRGDPRGEAPLPGRADHARRVQRLVRPQSGRPGGAQLGVPRRVRARPGWTRRSCTRRRSCRSPGSPTTSARRRSTSSTTGGGDGYDPLARFLELFEGVDAASAEGQPGRRAGRAAAVGAAEAADHRRRADRARSRPRRGAGQPARPGDRQRRAARRDEDRRRAVRLRPDAAAVRAAVGRGDEGGRRLPRAAHGAHGRGGQGHDRAGDGQGRRARHRQEPRRHHPVQQRLRRGQPRHQAADLGASCEAADRPRGRRDRHVRPAGEVDRGDAGKPRRAELARAGRPLAGAARRRRADPGLRRAGPRRACSTARSVTPATRSRGCG